MRGHLRAALISINNVTSPGRRTPDDFIRDMSSANDIARSALLYAYAESK